MDFERHPFSFVSNVLERSAMFHAGARLEFSAYEYKPQSVDDFRRQIYVLGKELSLFKIRSVVDGIGPREELAFHSRLQVAGREIHLPMIDFGEDVCLSDLKLASDMLRPSVGELQYYRSGRSFHAYGSRLLSKDEWISFMGLLLLLTSPGRPHIADSRWIGHRLLAGYSSLRWTCNTSCYRGWPEVFTF